MGVINTIGAYYNSPLFRKAFVNLKNSHGGVFFLTLDESYHYTDEVIVVLAWTVATYQCNLVLSDYDQVPSNFVWDVNI